MSAEKKFYLRLNGRDDLKVHVGHVEQISSTEVVIKDEGTFPSALFKDGPVYATRFELMDERSTVWAFRMLPPDHAVLLNNDTTLKVCWVLTINKEGDGGKVGSEGEEGKGLQEEGGHKGSYA